MTDTLPNPSQYPAPVTTTKPWLSKTIIANVVMAVAAFFPTVNAHLTPETLATVFTVVNIILRSVTKTGLSIK